MEDNFTLKHQLQHRSIRSFSTQKVTKQQLQTLYEVARQTATSMFNQQFSIIRVTDIEKRNKIRTICQQDYVGKNGELLIFVVDLYRNYQIRQQQGNDAGRLHTTDVFMQGVCDTLLAAQNVTNAAESMGLGCVYLGSIQNDAAQMLEVLKLPKLTYPLLGMQVGYPAQHPQLKPRLPLEFTCFENEYQAEQNIQALADYDAKVNTYYDLRDTNQRIDTFTNQINSAKLDMKYTKRDEMLEILHRQELCWK